MTSTIFTHFRIVVQFAVKVANYSMLQYKEIRKAEIMGCLGVNEIGSGSGLLFVAVGDRGIFVTRRRRATSILFNVLLDRQAVGDTARQCHFIRKFQLSAECDTPGDSGYPACQVRDLFLDIVNGGISLYIGIKGE
jgi:hypothetical protein